MDSERGYCLAIACATHWSLAAVMTGPSFLPWANQFQSANLHVKAGGTRLQSSMDPEAVDIEGEFVDCFERTVVGFKKWQVGPCRCSSSGVCGKYASENNCSFRRAAAGLALLWA